MESLESLWDEEANGRPFDKSLTRGSKKECNWSHVAICGCVHKWCSSMMDMTRPSNGIGCTRCGKQTIPCCEKTSLVSSVRFQEIKNEWNDITPPSNYFPNSNVKVSWKHMSPKCGCVHKWDAAICARIRQRKGCAICAHQASPCCQQGTVASDVDMMQSWDVLKNKELDPRKLYLGSDKCVWWKCTNVCVDQDDCKHEWFTNICTRRRHGCPFCAGLSIIPCCLSKSLGAPVYNQILLQWDWDKNCDLHPRSLRPASTQPAHWICRESRCGCTHSWVAPPNNRVAIGVSKAKRGCPFCTTNPQFICCKFHCRSLSQWLSKEKLLCIINNLNLDLNHVPLASNKPFQFRCTECTHVFVAQVCQVTANRGGWCPYCAHKRVCGSPSCSTCRMKCVMATCYKMARRQTKITRKWYCESCLADCIANDPNETPLQLRAKISLEIYFLAELQNLDESRMFYNPTSWDCAIYPGLAFKPDCAYIFSRHNRLLKTCGAEKINKHKIGYILQLEIIEESRASHSAARSISDKDREAQIRQVFQPVPMGFLYVTVAHTKHTCAHADDIYFQKSRSGIDSITSNTEYALIPARADAFRELVVSTLAQLFEMLDTQLDGTRCLGH